MFVAAEPTAIRRWSRAKATEGAVVALVPTMGALHDGHLALVEEARRHADVVVVSIFVNPLQFDRGTDFDAYPRPIEADLDLCRAHDVAAVYAPTAAAMYPQGFDTRVEPGSIATVLEGQHRPGHFVGVATVVTKLFAAVEPHLAVFGEKDFQQLAVIRRMTKDLDLGVDIIGLPTVREPDGVAMSSRNRRLSPDQRRAATCVPRALRVIAAARQGGERSADALVAIGREVIATETTARLEHLEIVDSETFSPTTELSEAIGHAVAVTAVWFGDVRLIDNMVL